MLGWSVSLVFPVCGYVTLNLSRNSGHASAGRRVTTIHPVKSKAPPTTEKTVSLPVRLARIIPPRLWSSLVGGDDDRHGGLGVLGKIAEVADDGFADDDHDSLHGAGPLLGGGPCDGHESHFGRQRLDQRDCGGQARAVVQIGRAHV